MSARPAAVTEREPAVTPIAPHDELGRAFKAAMAAVRRLRGRETHHPGELSYAQYSLLFSLAGGEMKSARELAELADLSPATVAQMLDNLAGAELVVRVRSDEDKRIVLTSLTERGREVIEARRCTMEPRWRSALSEFSDSELRTAARVLDRLHDLFEQFAEHDQR
ncbi:MAG TPA: MarR family transcriptional regulator [Solirubrobacteraceae bacterium]|nr:MarR family transcriptional regulator [Solirubrobacteraceae bacterium]